MKTNTYRLLQLAAALLTAQVSQAQYALFDQNTDTIAFSGNTILGTTTTYEAIVSLSNPAYGSIFFEQINSQEHKQIALSSTLLRGIGFTLPLNTPYFDAATSISLNVFHHVAFVRDGSDERLYLDGGLLASRSVVGDIDDALQIGHPGAIGASQFDTTNASEPSFLGLLNTVRVSNVARYSGASFAAPSGDLMSDANTLLLYNFNPEEVSGSTITDLSGNGHTGTFASGFTGATAPTIVPEPSSVALLLLGGAFCLRRRSLRTHERNA